MAAAQNCEAGDTNLYPKKRCIVITELGRKLATLLRKGFCSILTIKVQTV